MSRLLAFGLPLLASTLAAQAAPDFYDDTVVRRVDLIFHQTNYWSTLKSNYSTKTYMKGDLKIDGITFKDVGIRFRGNSSYWGLPSSSLKRGFKISIDEYVPDRKYQDYKTLNFNNNFADPSWLREIVSYGIFRRFMPTPKCNYIHLYINGQSWGPYFNTQQVNKAMLQEWMDDNDGNRYRGERDNLLSDASGTALTWLGNSAAPYQAAYELKLKNAPNPWNDLIRVCDVLNNTPANILRTALPKVLDVDNALWMHANASVLIWLDSYIGRYCHNFYICNDLSNGRMMLTPWDTNGCFGGYTDRQSKVHTLSPFYNENHSSRPLFTRLVKDPVWRQRYLAHIRTILDTEYDWPKLEPRIKRYRALIDNLVKNDRLGIYSYQNFVDNWQTDVRVRSWGWSWTTIPGLRSFAQKRAAALRAHPEIQAAAPTLSDLSRNPAAPVHTEEVFITAKVTSSVAIGGVDLFYRTKGRYIQTAMFDDGKHGDGAANDSVYGAKIGKQPGGSRVEYYVSARSTAAHASAMTFLPRTASNRPPAYEVGYPTVAGPVVLNELLTKNTVGLRDQKGEREDWIELRNTSNSPVAIGGMHLSDDFTNPKKWMIPGGTTISAKGSVLIWCDGDPGDGPLHANFKLATTGERVGLFDATGTTLADSIRWGLQAPDVSFGRLTDGRGPWVSLLTPTPLAPNVMSCGARRFSAAEPFTHRFSLKLEGSPKVGTSPKLEFAGGPVNSAATLFIGTQGNHLRLTDGLVLLLGGVITGPFSLPTDASGGFALGLPIPNSPAVVGANAYLQVGTVDALGLSGSNAVHVIICQ